MFVNTSEFSPNDDDANYDENDAAWKEEEKNELDEFGFKSEDDEEEEEKTVKTKAEDEDDEDEEDDDNSNEGFGLEKDA